MPKGVYKRTDEYKKELVARCEHMRKFWKGRKHSLKSKIQMRKSQKGLQAGTKHPLFGKHANEKTKNKLKESGKRLWSDKEYREKQIRLILKTGFRRPTKLEKEMIQLIKKYNLPYKYVGDFSFWIGGKNPDFVNINGEKKLIEVGNVFHHQDNYTEKRRAHFAQYGWESYIFIGDKLNEEKIISTLTMGL